MVLAPLALCKLCEAHGQEIIITFRVGIGIKENVGSTNRR